MYLELMILLLQHQVKSLGQENQASQAKDQRVLRVPINQMVLP